LLAGVCADLGGAFDFDGCCAPAGEAKLETTRAVTRIASFAEFFITVHQFEDRPADQPSFASREKYSMSINGLNGTTFGQVLAKKDRPRDRPKLAIV
jgi:hypothetical protein